MIKEIALTRFLGQPLVILGGMLTLLLLLLTALISYLNSKGKSPIPFKWHPRLAVVTIIVAIIHGLFGMSIFKGF